MSRPRRVATGIVRGVWLVVCVGWIGCADAAREEPDAEAERAPAAAPASDGATRVYEREIVFLATSTDSSLVVPWHFSAAERGSVVDRQIRGWLSRNGSWEAFLNERWQGPATRAPWRILPRGPVRLVVGLDDALERVVYERGPRRLEVGFGSLLAEWTTAEGRVFRVHEASAALSAQQVGGVLLDINRARPARPIHGEWIFLVSGDSVQVLVDGVRPADVPLGGAGGWGRVDFRQLEWPDLRLTWTEVRAFERARRDVPVEWQIGSVDGTVQGMVAAVTTEIEAGEGSGPRLPVYALFEVEGELEVEGSTFPVRGLLRHTQN